MSLLEMIEYITVEILTKNIIKGFQALLKLINFIIKYLAIVVNWILELFK